LHGEWKGEKEEKEGEVHGWRARRRRLGKMNLQRRAHEFTENEGKLVHSNFILNVYGLGW
jgi:hypothetical protein